MHTLVGLIHKGFHYRLGLYISKQIITHVKSYIAQYTQYTELSNKFWGFKNMYSVEQSLHDQMQKKIEKSQ